MEWLAIIGGIAGLISAILAIPSAVVSHYEWRKIKKKIAMLTDASKAIEVLPAWYTERMMQDDWLFGLLTNDGRTIAVTKITAISDDGKWMDVDLASDEQVEAIRREIPEAVIAIAKDRLRASVQISSIVAAMELQTS